MTDRSKINDTKIIEQNVNSAHYPVMLQEMLNYLNVRDGKIYLDCTFGAGGYSRAILGSANCVLHAIDRDINVQTIAEDVKKSYHDNFYFHHGNFADAADILSDQKFDGIVMDLGVSSMQLDNSDRGFSFQKESYLDMRMDQSSSINAFEVINNIEETDLANIIYKYGDEPKSRHIAKAIVTARAKNEITTTTELADIIRSVTGQRRKGKKIDPATKTFQAIRIFVNSELQSLELFLEKIKEIVNSDARIVIVSFHSLEDIIVKNFFKNHAVKKIAKSKYSTKIDEPQEGKWLEILTRKVLVPSSEEVSENIRSRSAKMRACKIIGGIL